MRDAATLAFLRDRASRAHWVTSVDTILRAVVHRHRRHIVIAARDGYVQITRWSPLPLTEAAQIGR